MGDIDRVPPVPPAVHAALAAQRAGDQRRRRPDEQDRETPTDTVELHGEEEPVPEAALPPCPEDPDADGLDIAV